VYMKKHSDLIVHAVAFRRNSNSEAIVKNRLF